MLTSDAAVQQFEAALDAVLARPAEVDSPTAITLYDAAHAARMAGQSDFVDTRLEAARAAGAGGDIRVLNLAYLLENDAAFCEQTSSQLRIHRRHFTNSHLSVPQLELECFATSEGAFLPRVIRPGEVARLSIAAEIQLFVNADLTGHSGAECASEDSSHLQGHLAAEYSLRLISRLVWGVGVILITDQRVLGLVFDDEVPGIRSSDERDRMPIAYVDGDGSGSVIVFEASRSAFTETQVATGFMAGKLPPGNIIGEEVSLSFVPHAVVDAAHRLVKPAKGAIVEAVGAIGHR